MRELLVILLLFVVAGLAIGVGLLAIGRSRRAPKASPAADPGLAGLDPDRIVSVLGESNQRQIDQRLGDVIESFEAKVASIDAIVAERVGGMAGTIGESVGGMSRNLGTQVDTMSGELNRLRGLLSQLKQERAEQFGQFAAKLEATNRSQELLATEARHLREALANTQTRGQWGERMAEDVLRAMGMRKDINYRTQHTLAGGTKPDFTFLLPENRLLHMDVKFPFTNYLRYLEAESDAEADRFRTMFLRDVRDRVKELRARDYASPDSTVGYLLLFIPNESVYGFIHEHDHALLDDSMANKVVLCSPTSLYAVLGVVRQAMDTFALTQATGEILDCLANFEKQWTKFTGAIDTVERRLESLTAGVGDLAGRRRRALERQIDRIDDVRAGAGMIGSHAAVDSNVSVLTAPASVASPF